MLDYHLKLYGEDGELMGTFKEVPQVVYLDMMIQYITKATIILKELKQFDLIYEKGVLPEILETGIDFINNYEVVDVEDTQKLGGLSQTVLNMYYAFTEKVDGIGTVSKKNYGVIQPSFLELYLLRMADVSDVLDTNVDCLVGGSQDGYRYFIGEDGTPVAIDSNRLGADVQDDRAENYQYFYM